MVIYIANNYMTYILQATNRIKPYAIVVMAEKMVFALYVGVCWVCKVKSFEVIAIVQKYNLLSYFKSETNVIRNVG